jgi:hypothetical protein
MSVLLNTNPVQVPVVLQQPDVKEVVVAIIKEIGAILLHRNGFQPTTNIRGLRSRHKLILGNTAK